MADSDRLITAGYSMPQVVKDGRKIPVWFEGALVLATAVVITGCAGTGESHLVPPASTPSSAPQSVVGPIAL